MSVYKMYGVVNKYHLNEQKLNIVACKNWTASDKMSR